jgi:hypothetical protein
LLTATALVLMWSVRVGTRCLTEPVTPARAVPELSDQRNRAAKPTLTLSGGRRR